MDEVISVSIDVIAEAQLKAFRKFLKVFKEKDDNIERIFERGEEPTRKEEEEFEKLKKEYLSFKKFFETYDGNYWGSLSVLDVVELIKDEAQFIS